MAGLLQTCFPSLKTELIVSYEEHVVFYCEIYEINTSKRLSAFLAQVAHESANFSRIEENLNYSPEGLVKTFPKYFPTLEKAKDYARKPQKIASKVYANRMGNDDEESKDGWTYRGRGLIQITGKDNYERFASAIGKSLEETVNYLETPEGAVHSAGWFWDYKKLNFYADGEDLKTMTRLINGGLNGLEDRIKKYNTIYTILDS